MSRRTKLTFCTLFGVVALLCGGMSAAGPAADSGSDSAANVVGQAPTATVAPSAPAAHAAPANQATAAGVVTPASGANGAAAAPVANAPGAPPPQLQLTPQTLLPATPATLSAPTPPSPPLVVAQRSVDQLQFQARTTNDEARLAAIRVESAKAQAAADTLASSRSKELRTIDRELAQLSAISRRHKLSVPEQVHQKELLAKRGVIEGQLNQARAVSSAASHAYDLVAERRRESFTSKIFEQTASPVSPDFWTALSQGASTDDTRFVGVAERAVSAALEATEPKGLVAFVVSLAIAFVLAFPVRRLLDKLVRAKTAAGASHGFRLSAHAVWVAVVDTALPGLAANTLHLGAQWGGLLSEKANALAGAVVLAVSWGAAVVALGRATVASEDADARLMEVPDEAVRRVRFYLWMVALITGCGFLLTRLNDVVGASVAATIAANCALSLAYAGVAALVLVSFGRNRAPADVDHDARATARGSGWTLLSLILTTAIIVTVGAVLSGYTTLAVLISNQIFWLSMLCAVVYLLLRFISDLCGVLFQPRGWAARTLVVLFNLRAATINQLGVLVAAVLQLAVLLGALSLAITPFGDSGATLASHFDRIGHNIHIGSATLSPTSLFAGLATLIVGLLMAHGVRGWMTRRYLPVTGWDAGLRNSVGTGVSYIGVGAAVLCALATMGLGFKQIALVASALSVGIGFGLQQVVQNFVSGVILLVERPVKVGDWVNVGGVEGDVRSIRVRATEIQTFDRTTLIVPNSDLITKTVQNKTLGDPRGRVQLQVSIADPKQGSRAADLLVEIAEANALVLADPPPAVYIDSLASAGAINFNCYFYVSNPRDVYKTRSNLYRAILDNFLKEGIVFMGTSGPTNVVLEAGPKLSELWQSEAVKPPQSLTRKTVAPV